MQVSAASPPSEEAQRESRRLRVGHTMIGMTFQLPNEQATPVAPMARPHGSHGSYDPNEDPVHIPTTGLPPSLVGFMVLGAMLVGRARRLPPPALTSRSHAASGQATYLDPALARPDDGARLRAVVEADPGHRNASLPLYLNLEPAKRARPVARRVRTPEARSRAHPGGRGAFSARWCGPALRLAGARKAEPSSCVSASRSR